MAEPDDGGDVSGDELWERAEAAYTALLARDARRAAALLACLQAATTRVLAGEQPQDRYAGLTGRYGQRRGRTPST